MKCKLFSVGFCLLFVISLGGQSDLPGVIIEKPKSKAIWNQYNLDKHLYNWMLESTVNLRGVVNVIDKEYISVVNDLRKNALKSNPDLPSAQMIGADYIIESRVISYDETYDTENENVENKNGKIESKCTKKTMKVIAKLNMNLVSVETGDVISSKEFLLSAKEARSCSTFDSEEKTSIVRQKCIDSFRSCMHILFRVNMMELLQSRLKVGGVLESKKNSAKKLVMESGPMGSFQKGVNLDVMSVAIQEVGDGKKVKRETIIGEAKIDEIHEGYCILKVKKGGKEIYQSLSNNTELYVSYGKNYVVDRCSKARLLK